MSEALTFEQQQAVENRDGKLLVSAAAGSGKTKVLVDRLMGYILDPNKPANIDDFLMITYTKAAASELRGKIATKLSELVATQPNNKHLRQQLQFAGSGWIAHTALSNIQDNQSLMNPDLHCRQPNTVKFMHCTDHCTGKFIKFAIKNSYFF